MKLSKISPLLVLFLAIIIGGAALSTPLFTFAQVVATQSNSQKTPSESNKVILLVEQNVADALKSELDTYSADIQREYGFRTTIRRVLPSDTVAVLKNYVVGEYQKNGLAGVLIVGNVPTGNFYDPTIDPSSVFNSQGDIKSDSIYRDILDACTYHADTNAYSYENANCTLSSIPTEAYWIGRITPNSSTQSSITLLKDYFNRNHSYRTGTFSYQKKVLVYVPLPEADSATINRLKDFSLFNAYSSNQVNIVDQTSKTSDQTYLSELKKVHGYELVYFNGHGAPKFHEKDINSGPVGTEGERDPASLRISGASAFLEFFGSCSVGRFTTPDYMAGKYLFSDSLVAIAPSVPVFAATQAPQALSYLLVSGKPVFEALKMLPLGGSNLLGDPTLRMRYQQTPIASNKPVITVDKKEIILNDLIQSIPLTIRNKGNSKLLFDAAHWAFSPKEDVSVRPDLSFSSSETISGGIEPGSSGVLTFTSFPWENLRVGIYTGTLSVLSNDPISPILKIPLTVKKGAVPQVCLNGLDVKTYPKCICPIGKVQSGNTCLFKSSPTVSLAPLPNDGLDDGRLIRFKVTADSLCDIGIAKFNFRVSRSNAILSAYQLSVYSDLEYSVAVPVPGNTSGRNSIGSVTYNERGGVRVTTSFEGKPLQIPAGQSRYFELRAKVTPSGDASATTTLLSDSTSYTDMLTYVPGKASKLFTDYFVWSPNTTTTSQFTNTDWTNGFNVTGLSMDSVSQLRTWSMNPSGSISATSCIAGSGSTLQPKATNVCDATVSWSTTGAKSAYVTIKGDSPYTVKNYPYEYTAPRLNLLKGDNVPFWTRVGTYTVSLYVNGTKPIGTTTPGTGIKVGETTITVSDPLSRIDQKSLEQLASILAGLQKVLNGFIK